LPFECDLQRYITGAVLTKMDGDTRGGAALSVREAGPLVVALQVAFERQILKLVFHLIGYIGYGFERL
jgi:hypothetical protein